MAKGDDIQERLINFAVEIIKRSKMLPLQDVLPVANECTELCKIISSSIRTVGKKH